VLERVVERTGGGAGEGEDPDERERHDLADLVAAQGAGVSGELAVRASAGSALGGSCGGFR